MPITIRPGDTGIDFSYSKPPAARLVELGYRFVVGYVSPNPDKNLLDPWQYISAGLGVVYVFELTATRPNQGGDAGRQDGAFARLWLERCGYPTDVPVVVAFDTNTSQTNLAAHVAYFNGFKTAAAPYLCGAYEDTDLARYTDAETTIDWLPLAWSWSSSVSLADARRKAYELGFHVFQGKGFWIDGKWAVDPNVCVRPFPAWGLAPPAPQEADMPAFISNKQAGKYGAAPSPQGGCTIWELVEGRKRALSLAEWNGYGNPFGVALPDSDLDQIPDFAPQPVPEIDYVTLAEHLAGILPTRFNGSINITAAG